MRAATFDSSFWVHAVYMDPVEFLLSDFELICTKAVENELGRDNPTSHRLKVLLTNKRIKRPAPRSEKIKLYGDGEKAAGGSHGRVEDPRRGSCPRGRSIP